MDDYKIAYVMSDLKRVGPTNQTLNIIKNPDLKDKSIVITLFEETNDSMKEEYIGNEIRIECLNLNKVSFALNGVSKLEKILKKYSINLVHSYGIKPDYLSQKACNRLDITHVITLRNYPKEDILTRMGKVKGRIALRNHLKTLLKADNVVCCSKTICDKMKKDYPEKIFTYIQNGVDIEKYKKVDTMTKRKIREQYGFDNNKKIFISTGSFTPRKRIEEAIKGFLKGNRNDDILLLLGDGSLFNDLKMKYENNENIIFYGKSSKVEELLQLSDYFISSSESEGLPNGVIEAIACGLPVILSDIPQHIEILSEVAHSGVSYHLGDYQELAETIANYEQLQNKVGDIKSSSLTMENMSKKYVEYYKGKNGVL